MFSNVFSNNIMEASPQIVTAVFAAELKMSALNAMHIRSMLDHWTLDTLARLKISVHRQGEKPAGLRHTSSLASLFLAAA